MPYEAVLDALGDQIAVLDGDGVIVVVNRAWRDFATANGAPADVVRSVGLNYLSACGGTPDAGSASEAEAGIRAVLSGEVDSFELEYPCDSPDERRWFHMSVTPMVDRDDGPRVVVCHHNITDRRNAEESLRASQIQLRAIFDTEPECVKVIAPNGDLLEMNSAGLRMLEAESFEAVRSRGSNFFIVPEDQEAFAALHRDVMAGGDGVLEYEVIGLRGTRRRLETHATPMRDAAGEVTMLLAITRDVTERRRLEAQLLQAAKTESIGRLAGGIAHDFNNMLTVILARAEVVLGQLDPADPSRVHLQNIHSAAERSADLTRQLLAFARQQVNRPRAIAPDAAVTSLMPILHRLIDEDIRLSWNADENLWPIKIDPSQFHQVLTNLVVNARDAITATDVADGTITISASNAVIDDAYCTTHWYARPGEHVRLAVIDNGIGIDAQAHRTLFEPFFTTKQPGTGTGLGLSTVYGIVEQNHGFITVTSAPGEGATFEVFLPRHEGPVESGAEDRLHENGDRRHETILVAEDEPAILDLITTILKAGGYHVLAASDASEAVRLARNHHDQIDLLLTDVVMAGMNGRDLAGTLTEAGIHTRHLFMPGYPADVITHRGVLGPDTHFIQKPFGVNALTAKVRDILDTESLPLPCD